MIVRAKPKVGLDPRLHDYQQDMVNFCFYRLAVLDEFGAGLFADPGLGKTFVTLELIRKLRQHGMARRVLIIAPLDVVYNTWPDQIEQWGYNWKPRIIHSPTNNTAQFRSRQLSGGASLIHMINPEGVQWLSAQRQHWDLIIVDESTKFKTWGANRTQALRAMVDAGRVGKVVILTGTPTPNGLHDVFPQVWMLDQGEALGPNVTYFRNWACRQGSGQYGLYKWEVTPEAEDMIHKRIAHLVRRVDAADHLDLPHVHHNRVAVKLPDEARAIYDRVEAELFALLDSGVELSAANAGVKYGLCRQIANGGAWSPKELGDRTKLHMHTAKVDAAQRIVDELNGKPVIIAYQFDHDVDRLHKVWKKAPVIKGGVSPVQRRNIIRAWNRKEVPVLLVQPAALAHGANMQAGGANMIWMGHTDQLELHQQLERRIWRQGQEDDCRFHYILAEDTVDEAVEERLTDKSMTQGALMHALKAYRQKHQRPAMLERDLQAV